MALEWAAREGWNPGVNDAACFYAADAGGFLVGELDGEPVAVISAVRYGAGFGFLGLYIVAPSQRGRGYGLGIWQAAILRLQGRSIGLDGVVAQQDNYRKSGFRTAHRNVRYEGIGGPAAEGDSQLPGLAGGEMVDLCDAPFAELSDYDRQLFPGERPQFLKAWIGQPHSAALGVRVDGRLAGWSAGLSGYSRNQSAGAGAGAPPRHEGGAGNRAHVCGGVSQAADAARVWHYHL